MDEDLQKLQGEWNIVFLEVDGIAPAPNTFAGAKITIEGDRFTTLGMGGIFEGNLAVNSASSPKSLRMAFTAGPEKGNTNHGIYELEGDRLRLCLCVTGGAAPTEFATSPGSGCALETLDRTSRAPTQPPPPIRLW